jgi:hypothetical protein
MFNYSSNGSLDTVVSYGVENGKSKVTGTTYYANNRPSYVTNAQGAVTASYTYASNGLLQYVSSFNNGAEASRTIFMLGQQVMTVDVTAQGANNFTYQDYIQAYRQIKTPGADISSIEHKYHVTSFALFYSDLSNAGLLNYLKKENGFDNSDIARMMKDSNGYSAVGNVTTVINEDTVKDSNTEFFLANGTKVNPSSYQSGNTTGQGTQKTTTTKGTKISHNVTVLNHGAQAYTVAGSENWKDLKTEVTTDTWEYRYQSDPAVVGTVSAYYDADGNVIADIAAYKAENPDAKIYAKINAEGINMMDGSGFKPADGEEIMIDISSLSKEEVFALSETGRGLFMGDVNRTSEGRFEMVINRDYNVEVGAISYGGFVTGADLDAAVAEADAQSKAALNGESKYDWMNKNTKDNRSIFGLVNPGQFLNDWKDGWAALAGWSK